MNNEDKSVKSNGLAFWCQEGVFQHFWDYLKSDFQKVQISNGQISDPHCNQQPLYFNTKMQVIHLSLDCLCKLENPTSQERPIFPQNNFKESSRNSAGVCHHVVGVGHEGEGVHPAPGDVCLE